MKPTADEKSFPIPGYFSRARWMFIKATAIPWGLIAPHERQAKENHYGQDLAKLASRGGLDSSEAVAVLEDRPWHLMDEDEARRQLVQKVSEYEQANR